NGRSIRRAQLSQAAPRHMTTGRKPMSRIIRVIFDLIGAPKWWSGVIVLVLGGGTAVLGILHAMMERDLKRLLAYST
ncbi:proton-conducting transporter membrane subunit, partial [Rhizobium ruizarguesonis]